MHRMRCDDRLLWWSMFVVVFGCGADAGEAASSSSVKDAGAKVLDAGVRPRRSGELNLLELELLPEDSERLQRFREAPAWEIGFWRRTGAFSGLKYEIMLDQAGNYYFDGISTVSVKGQHELTTDASEVRGLYNKLLDLGFLRLRDRYEYDADGCLLATEGSDFVMRMTIEEDNKPLTYYSGCMFRGPAYDALSGVMRAIVQFPPVQRLTGRGDALCTREHALKDDVEALGDEPLTFVVYTSEDKAVGVLKLAKQPGQSYQFRELTISDCQGKELTKTTKLPIQACGVTVYPEQEGTLLKWPGVDLEVHAAFIGNAVVDRDAADKDYAVRLLNIEREALLRAHRGSDRCEN